MKSLNPIGVLAAIASIAGLSLYVQELVVKKAMLDSTAASLENLQSETTRETAPEDEASIPNISAQQITDLAKLLNAGGANITPSKPQDSGNQALSSIIGLLTKIAGGSSDPRLKEQLEKLKAAQGSLSGQPALPPETQEALKLLNQVPQLNNAEKDINLIGRSVVISNKAKQKDTWQIKKSTGLASAPAHANELK